MYTITVTLSQIYCINKYITENSVSYFYQLISDIISFMHLHGYHPLKITVNCFTQDISNMRNIAMTTEHIPDVQSKHDEHKPVYWLFKTN
jgi:hypothetical protein